jgi:hypothetical protein
MNSCCTSLMVWVANFIVICCACDGRAAKAAATATAAAIRRRRAGALRLDEQAKPSDVLLPGDFLL